VREAAGRSVPPVNCNKNLLIPWPFIENYEVAASNQIKPVMSMEFNSISKSMMIPRRLGGGDEAYYLYVEETDDDANKGSA